MPWKEVVWFWIFQKKTGRGVGEEKKTREISKVFPLYKLTEKILIYTFYYIIILLFTIIIQPLFYYIRLLLLLPIKVTSIFDKHNF